MQLHKEIHYQSNSELIKKDEIKYKFYKNNSCGYFKIHVRNVCIEIRNKFKI